MAAARTEGDLESLAGEAELDYLVGTVATPEGCAAIVEETTRRLGPIEILINNAGIASRREREIWDLDPDVWHETMATNLHGPFELTRLVAGAMVERRYGRIVMVSSTAGQVGGAKYSAYCASKHALLGLMRCVAQDGGPYGVTCNAVCPGWVNTPMAQEAMEHRAREHGVTREEAWADAVSIYPAKRMLEPEEIAATIAFLASEEASGINGEAVTVALGGLW
jgi:NAD(P)-dependent dehydrogenase (short-subunit alcohol dehydrogenase family)